MDNKTHAQPGEGQLSSMLQNAHAALDRGEIGEGREQALAMLKAAEQQQNSLFEARALLCLAHCDRMVSRYRRAHRASRRAANIFHLLGDTSGEVMALTTHAFVSINLGRNEEAVETALLAVRLSELLPSGEHSLLAYNYLGIAYLWSRSLEKAEKAFDMAIQIANAGKPPFSTFQVCVNQWWAEVVRNFYQRYYTGVLPSPKRLHALRQTFVELANHGEATGFLHGTNVTTSAVLLFSSALNDCWRGNLAHAQKDVEKVGMWAQRYGTHTWLNALECWVRAEICWAQKDLPSATQYARKMIAMATDVQHEQLACLGYLLSSQLLTEQGQHAQALEELRQLRLREQQIRTDCLESREEVVEWQVNLRQHKQSMQRMEITSRALEKLSMEDSLTGIANRRRFEQFASKLLNDGSETGQPHCVALIDIDKFKSVNDNFSHQVGDAVLKRVAQILRSHVRDEDLPARLAGDEFVIMFKHTPIHIAQQACARIEAAVKHFEWASVRPGLAVTISVGVAVAGPGDTVDSLTHRSDVAMYGQKKGAAH
jgi:diguanylate cyclase (GGDEF)-like protein